ncbi:MAG: hypothetical protein JWO69_1389 [Thermoleophilia bacterium]|nr:hypothetical protein [Thermoleophilia bacterium]
MLAVPIGPAEMHPRLLPILVACSALLACPAVAAAATPPTLQSPAGSGAEFKVGGSIAFEWSGELQGDPDALDRSNFRVEIAKASDVPSGSQSEWDATEDFRVTTSGVQETSATMGVPDAGTYKWRVCAWGVVDDLVANVVEQLPGGCSSARSFTTVVAAAAVTSIGQLDQKTTTVQPGTTKVIEVERQETTEPVAEEPVVAAPEPEVLKPVTPAGFQEVVTRSVPKAGSAVDLGRGDFSADSVADRERSSVGKAITGGLNATLPFIPIPFWTLVLLAVCFPLARAWRRDVMTMFDWSDGTIDGSGDAFIDLRNVQRNNPFKEVDKPSDGQTHQPAASVPDRERIPV